MRGEQSAVPKVRVEVETPTTNKNAMLNHLTDQIIGSKEKGVMKRRRINEELCLISQVETKSVDEAIKDNHWMKTIEEELQHIIKIDTW